MVSRNGGLDVLVRQRGPAPGLPNAEIDFFSPPALLIDGNIGFVGFLRNVASPANEVLFGPRGEISDVEPIITGGTADVGPIFISGFSAYGDALFQTRIAGPGITTDNDDRLVGFERVSDFVTLVAQEGSPVGSETDFIIDTIPGQPRPGILGLGAAQFQLDINENVGFNESFVITSFVTASVPTATFFRTGQPVPGVPTLSFGGSAGSVESLVTNNFAQTAFIADIVGEGVEFGVSDNAVFSEDLSGVPTLRLRRGSQLPGTDEIISALNSVLLNDDGDLLVSADVRPQNSFNGTSIFLLLHAEGGMREIFRERQSIPAFGDLQLTSSTVAFNAAGDVAILASRRDPVTRASAGETLLINRVDDPGLIPVVTSGDQILVEGQIRTVADRFSIAFAGSSQERPYSGLGDNGEIVATVFFTDGSQLMRATRFRAQADCNADGDVDVFDVIAGLREIDRLRSLGFQINLDRDGNGIIEVNDLLVCPNQLLPTPIAMP